MARVQTVMKARKAQGKCAKCSKPIEVGDAYRHVTIKTGQRSSVRKVRCMDSKCSFRPSDLTVSRRGEAYAAQEGMEDALNAWTPEEGIDALTSELENTAEAIREVASGYEESAENIRDGFGHDTYQSEELDDIASQLNDWADTVEQALSSAEDAPDEDDIRAEIEAEETQGEGESEQEFADRVTDLVNQELASRLDSWADDIRSEVDSALSECPV